MEIEKTLTVSAPRERVWAMLLDPNVMGGAVPGMKSIEVISPTEYVAVMHQKIALSAPSSNCARRSRNSVRPNTFARKGRAKTRRSPARSSKSVKSFWHLCRTQKRSCASKFTWTCWGASALLA